MSKTIRQGSMLALLAVYVLFAALTVQAGVNDPTQKLLQMLDYIGVDYPPTVAGGNDIGDVTVTLTAHDWIQEANPPWNVSTPSS